MPAAQAYTRSETCVVVWPEWMAVETDDQVSPHAGLRGRFPEKGPLGSGIQERGRRGGLRCVSVKRIRSWRLPRWWCLRLASNAQSPLECVGEGPPVRAL